MHDASLTREAVAARQGPPEVLAGLLQASRADTLATFARYEQTLPGLRVPREPGLNPPLWELGHVGWFQAWWIGRNPAIGEGAAADPFRPRRPPWPPEADALYDSSRVPHERRWQLRLPDAGATREALARQLEQTLALLGQAGDGDDALYFFRLALMHEDMHHEAALYMARRLGIAIDDPRWQPRPLPEPGPALALPARCWTLGDRGGGGFRFDNEIGVAEVALAAFSIDAQVLRWAEFLPFVAAGGYEQPRWWSEAGARWRAAQAGPVPAGLRREAGVWQQRRAGRWVALDEREAACHLSCHEAEAWCRWAGRRLPTEAEWACAAGSAGAAFRWGEVWEWTASPFAPFPGFRPHPYREYSAPWFDGRLVLKGASHLTSARMRHPDYRNFFEAGRRDVPAGFRSCAA